MDDSKLESRNVSGLYRVTLMAHLPHLLSPFFFLIYFLLPFIGLKKGSRLIFFV